MQRQASVASALQSDACKRGGKRKATQWLSSCLFSPKVSMAYYDE